MSLHVDLKRFMKKAGQRYVVVRGGVRGHQLEGLVNVEKATGRRYIGFYPGSDIQPGDWVEGLITGDRSYIDDVSSDVVDGQVFMVKGYSVTPQEYERQKPPSRQGVAAVSQTASGEADPRKVFVVFGRNHGVRDEMYTFVGALGLRPVEFDDAVRATGEGTPTIDRILDAAFSLAQAVIILLTGDDEARLQPRYQQADDPAHEKQLTPQPRPNVLFEAGMAFGRNPSRSILVQFGDIRPFSDISARYSVRFTGSIEDRVRLKDRLKTAGCLVDDSGTHWYAAGDFAKVLAPPGEPQARR